MRPIHRSPSPSSSPSRRAALAVAALAWLVLSLPALAQGWSREPRAVFELSENYGGNDKLDEKGEQVVGVSSTDLNGGLRGILFDPPQNFVTAGYELRAVASVQEVVKGRYGSKVHCRVEWTLTNTSPGPLQPRITAFASGIRELDAAIAASLPLAPQAAATARQERVHDKRCRLRLREIRGPVFNPQAPDLTTFELADDDCGDCLSGDRPAATLLVPYFEVDLDAAEGINTLAAVGNAAGTCVLSRVTLWTDLAVPTLSFYLFLSADDVQTLNLRDLFAGRLPDTSRVLADPSCPVLDFEPCTAAQLDTELVQLELRSVAAAHTGDADPQAGTCAGVDHGDGRARGYMTVDVVQRCAHDPTVATWAASEWGHPDGYHAATATSTSNVLWGDYFLVDETNDFAQSEAAVPVVADPNAFAPGDYTFYGRYHGFDASDARRPLSGRHGIRFLHGGPFDGGTELLVWRDSRSPQVAPAPCGELPPWAPLDERSIRLFDEDELPYQAPSGGVFPWATQRVRVGDAGFPSAVPFGWLDLDLWHDAATPAQAWVGAVVSARGRFSVQHRATRLDDLCAQPAVPAPAP